MSDLRTATITEILGDDRWAADRVCGLDPNARRLYALILYRFTEGGPPDRDELSRLGLGDDAISELVERDLAQLGPDGQVAVAYPFSTMPTPHQVRTQHGQSYWAMCAIDALGMPYLIHQAAEIRAREPGSDRAITIAIDAHRLRELVASGAQLVEVLPEDEYREEHLPGAINIPLKELDATTAQQLDQARAVVVYCWDGL
jgi:hypothetical protein